MKSKYRGHFCHICRKILPNEAFSVKGHARHICKKCSKLPKDKLQEKFDEEFIYNILSQKILSNKNLARMESISKKYPGELGECASVLLKVARIHPRKKKRLGFLYHQHRDLFDEMVRLNLIEDFITPMIQDQREYEKMMESPELFHNYEPEKDAQDIWEGEADSDDLPF